MSIKTDQDSITALRERAAKLESLLFESLQHMTDAPHRWFVEARAATDHQLRDWRHFPTMKAVNLIYILACLTLSNCDDEDKALQQIISD